MKVTYMLRRRSFGYLASNSPITADLTRFPAMNGAPGKPGLACWGGMTRFFRIHFFPEGPILKKRRAKATIKLWLNAEC